MNTKPESEHANAAVSPQGPSTTLSALGWREEFATGLPTPWPPGARLARVATEHRSHYEVHHGGAVERARCPRSPLPQGAAPATRPVVGDWVWLIASPDGGWQIAGCLPRFSCLRRGAAGLAHRTQIIASNIDTVLIVCGLDGDFNPRRIERYLAIVAGSGAQAVVVLTKADRCDDAESRRTALAAELGGEVPVLAVNAKSPDSIAALGRWLGAGQTLVLVGSSGAGKSTLTNTLLGVEKMQTGAVRSRDSRGRHTTSHRALLTLPGGACLIDTPGMREIKLLGDEDLSTASFADIEQLTEGCRFRDCRHQHEPGCALQAALAEGRLSAKRWESFRKLRLEQDQVRQRAEAQLRKPAVAACQTAARQRLQPRPGRAK